MLRFIKDLVSEKVQLRLVIQGPYLKEAALPLQSLIVSRHVRGLMNVGGSCIEIIAEGPRSRLGGLIKAISQAPFMPPTYQTKMRWSPFEGRYEGFRVSMGNPLF